MSCRANDIYFENKKEALEESLINTINLWDIVKKDLIKNTGKKCKDFNIGCPACQVYLAIEIIEDFFKVME